MSKEQLIEFVEEAHKNKVLNLFLVSLITSENTDEEKKVALDLAKRLVECADEINLPKTVKARVRRSEERKVITVLPEQVKKKTPTSRCRGFFVGA